MGFIKNIFGKKEEKIESYSGFWQWFQKNERRFFDALKNGKDIEKEFFDKLSPKLDELKDGCFYLTGMYNESTVELVLTADGDSNNIAIPPFIVFHL